MTIKNITYSDLNDKLETNIDGTIKMVTETDSISQSIITILSTSKGERIMLPQFGSNLRALVFSQMDDITARLIETEIIQAIGLWENRVSVRNVQITPDYDNNRYIIVINYIVTLFGVPQQIVTGLRSKA